MAIEVYFALNAVLDAALLWGCGRLTRRSAPLPRLLAAALFGALVASAATHPALAFLAAVPARLALPPLLLSWAYGFRGGLRRFTLLCAAFIALSVLVGGLAWALVLSGFAGPGASLLAACACILCAFPKPPAWDRALTVPLRVDGEDFCGFIDTGNRLREPKSGLPVVLAGAALLPHLGRETAAVYVTGVEGSALRRVYRLDNLEIIGAEGRRVLRVWALPCPETLPAGVDALLPAPSEWEEAYHVENDRKTA